MQNGKNSHTKNRNSFTNKEIAFLWLLFVFLDIYKCKLKSYTINLYNKTWHILTLRG